MRLLRMTRTIAAFLLLVYSTGCPLPSSLRVETPEKLNTRSLRVVEDAQFQSLPLTPPRGAGNAALQADQAGASLSRGQFLLHQAQSTQINALELARKASVAFSGSQDGLVVMSRIEAGAKVQTKTLLKGTKPILALALSKDERFLAVSQFSLISILDLETAQITAQLSRVNGRILSLDWDPRGELLAFGLANGQAYVWNVSGEAEAAGENDLRAVERYDSGSSQVIGLVFHPSGRSFYTAERGGGVFLWRLIRTERELGLRDSSAVVDAARIGRKLVQIARIPAAIEEIKLDKKREELLVAATDGVIYRWKIRGSKALDPLRLGVSAVSSLEPIAVNSLNLLATAGRDQRVQFWCSAPQDAVGERTGPGRGVVVLPTASSTPQNTELESSSGLDADLLKLLEPEKSDTAAGNDEFQLPSGLIARSEVFRHPFTLLRFSEQGSLLWAAEKTGRLLTFDIRSILRSPSSLARAHSCVE